MNNMGCESCVGDRREVCTNQKEQYVGALALNILLYLAEPDHASHADYLIANAGAAKEAFNQMRSEGCELEEGDFFDMLAKFSLDYMR